MLTFISASVSLLHRLGDDLVLLYSLDPEVSLGLLTT